MSSSSDSQQQSLQQHRSSQPEHNSQNPESHPAHQHQQQQQPQQTQQNQSIQTLSQFRAISRNNSNTSTASSGNRGDLSSTISTATSIASSRSQLSRNQLFDHRQLLSSCGGSSTPIRSFQRATISSVVKTRAFDNNPVLQGLLTATSSGQNSTSNSQTPSPLSTPVFSRSRSLRMSGGPRRYQQTPLHHRANSRTPDLYSFSSQNDSSNESHARILELSNERSELKESLEFLECERRVLMDSTKELREGLQKERSHWKKELEDVKKQLTDAIAARIKAESQVTRLEMELNDLRSIKRTHEQESKNPQVSSKEYEELKATNEELKRLLTEKIRYNGLNSAHECTSVVTEMAKLRIELNEKDKLIEQYSTSNSKATRSSPAIEIDTLNKFLDQTVECIKGWPEELAGSSHVQDLMKTLLSAYQPDKDCFEHL